MKNTLMAFFLFALTLSACNKESIAKQLSEDHGCIDKIMIPVTSHGTLSKLFDHKGNQYNVSCFINYKL